jgi:hypothetical protein
MSDSDSDYDEEVPVEEKPKPKGISALSSITGLGHAVGKQQKDETEAHLLGEEVTVVFQLPSGEAKKHQVKSRLLFIFRLIWDDRSSG